MGQLEKYGLYVLCLVIFLILGVTIWGGGDAQASLRRGPTTSQSNLRANPGTNESAALKPGDGGAALTPDLHKLLAPVELPSAPKKAPVLPVDQNGMAKVGGEASKGVGANASPTAEQTPPAPEVRQTYKVVKGDTLDSIARQKLGSPTLHTEIARLNPGVQPSRLQIGQELILPTTAELAAARGNLAPATTPIPAAESPASYTIAKGDTLESIAQRKLGSRKRTAELRSLNPEVDPDRLRIGQTIRLPQK